MRHGVVDIRKPKRNDSYLLGSVNQSMKKIKIRWNMKKEEFFVACPFCSKQIVIDGDSKNECQHVIYAHETVNQLLLGEYPKTQSEAKLLLAAKGIGFSDVFDDYIFMNYGDDDEGTTEKIKNDPELLEPIAEEFIQQGGLSVAELVRLLKHSSLSWLLKELVVASYIDKGGNGGTYYVFHPTYHNDVKLRQIVTVVESPLHSQKKETIREHNNTGTSYVPVIKNYRNMSDDEFISLMNSFYNNEAVAPELMVAAHGLPMPVSVDIAQRMVKRIRDSVDSYDWHVFYNAFKECIISANDQELLYELFEHVVSHDFSYTHILIRGLVEGNVMLIKQDALEHLKKMNTDRANTIAAMIKW